jgi:hypothetical protein
VLDASEKLDASEAVETEILIQRAVERQWQGIRIFAPQVLQRRAGYLDQGLGGVGSGGDHVSAFLRLQRRAAPLGV